MPSGLIANNSNMPKCEQVTINVKSSVRWDRMEGRDWIVASMVMLTEGVHNGTNGPLYYPEEELAKVPVVWNHKPIVVYHPQINGVGVSACDPEILTSRKVGVIMNTRWDAKAGKLRAEAWLDPGRVKAVDPRISDALENNRMVEVSTGLFTDNEAVDGKWGDESYVAVARNYRPDHLAILPDQTGACSIADGAGLLQSNSANGDVVTKSRVEVVLRENLATNAETSLQSILADLSQALSQRLGTDWQGWLEAAYSDFLVYYDTKAAKYMRLTYTMKDGKPVLGTEKPDEVRRVVEYRTVDGSFVGNNIPVKGNVMTREQKVAALIGNGGPWTESDRTFLMGCPDAALDHLCAGAQGGKPVANTTDEGAKDETLDEWLTNAPAAIRQLVSNALARDKAEKDRLIGIVTANKANTFPPDALAAMDIVTLQRLVAFAPGSTGVVVNYAGASGAPPTTTTTTPSTPAVVEPLPRPAMTY